MSKGLLAVAILLVASSMFAQDATKVEPKHYHVAFENEHVRVIDMHYGPHEKSGIHNHPAGVAVYITAGHFGFTDESGHHLKSLDGDSKRNTGRFNLPRLG